MIRALAILFAVLFATQAMAQSPPLQIYTVAAPAASQNQPFQLGQGGPPVGSILGGSGGSAPVMLIFSGIDPNPGPDSRLTVWPVSDAAEADFFSHLTSPGAFTFESVSTGVTTVVGSVGSIGFTLTGGTVLSSAGGDNAGRYAISNFNYYDTATQVCTIVFGTPIHSFGIYATDVGDVSGVLQLRLTNSLGGTTTLTVPSATGLDADGSVLYYGFIDPNNTYTKIEFLNSTSGSDGFGFDNLTVQ